MVRGKKQPRWFENSSGLHETVREKVQIKKRQPHIETLHCTVLYSSRNNYNVVYHTCSQNSVNSQMSLCSARVRFQDSANVSPSSAGLPKRKDLFPKKETNVPVTKMNENAIQLGNGALIYGPVLSIASAIQTGTWEINAGQIRGPAH